MPSLHPAQDRCAAAEAEAHIHGGGVPCGDEQQHVGVLVHKVDKKSAEQLGQCEITQSVVACDDILQPGELAGHRRRVAAKGVEKAKVRSSICEQHLEIFIASIVWILQTVEDAGGCDVVISEKFSPSLQGACTLGAEGEPYKHIRLGSGGSEASLERRALCGRA